MSTPNPLIPQGSLQAKAARGASNVRIAVATIIAIHVVFFGGLLLQGCKRDTKTGDAGGGATNTQSNADLTMPPMDTTANSLYYTNASTLPSPTTAAGTSNYSNTGSLSDYRAGTTQPPAGNNSAQDLWNPSPGSNDVGSLTANPGYNTGATSEGPMKDYTVVRGDSFYKIAKANGITIADLQKANPSVEPSRLQVGAKLKVPAKSATTTAGASNGGSTSGSSGKTYKVKPGDTLSKIARVHGVTVSEIRNANGMKLNRVNAGQTLKIPVKKERQTATGNSTAGGNSNGVNTNLTF